MGVEVDLMGAHGKRYRESRGGIDRERLYTPLEAVRALKGMPAAKFARPSRCTSASVSTSGTPTSSSAGR